MTSLSPDTAWQVLNNHNAPPRLIRHAKYVAGAAQRLIDGLTHQGFKMQADDILSGAILHDIGKTQHVEELSQPGKHHEKAGEALLLTAGIPAYIAQIARTHGTADPAKLALTDLVVALADKLWKGKRAADFEIALIDQLAAQTSQARWDIFSAIDDLFETIAADGQANLMDSQSG